MYLYKEGHNMVFSILQRFETVVVPRTVLRASMPNGRVGKIIYQRTHFMLIENRTYDFRLT